jgi:hypothetical protein
MNRSYLLRICFTALLACAGAACDRDISQANATCEQTYEFGNYGCAEVVGRVIGSTGMPLDSAFIRPSFIPVISAGTYNMPSVRTDAEGRFRLRIHRFGPRASPVMPDTFSIFVHAAVDYKPPATISPAYDSVLAVLELAPIGSLPKPATVEIRLNYP